MELSILMLMALSCVLSAILGVWMRSHSQFMQAYVGEVKKEYEIEGVLWETVSLLEERGPGFMQENLVSSFMPSYTVTITGDTITVRREGVLLLEARFRWKEGVIELLWVENPFVKPYAR
ncbi:MAG: hypothetical protein ABDK92_03020 [Atribacterota bacterium]